MTVSPPLPPNQSALAIHTSSPALGLAIDSFAGDRRCQTWDMGQALSTHLHLQLGEFLAPQTWQDLAFLAVAKGPGSFTGTRIGVVTARTIAQQLEIPLFACSTLAAVAQQHRHESLAADLAVQMPASRGQVFTAIYAAADLAPLLPDGVMSPSTWEEKLQAWQRPHHRIVAETNLGASAASLLDLAYPQWQRGDRPHWSAALPFYGQHPVNL